MRILYAAMKYDYGMPERGFGFEHYNFYDSLVHMGHDIIYFDYMTMLQERGKAWMNRRLLEVAEAERPDLMFTVLFRDEFDPSVLGQIRDDGLVTLNWFCDDHWRFDNYSRHWAPHFSWSVTTATSALPKYTELGYSNVIKSQWGCNAHLYRKRELPFLYDVSFIGQPHGNRRHIIQTLRHAGIKVHVWGAGWESGRLSQDDMIRVFNQSRINLNLTNASTPVTSPDAPVETSPARRTVRHKLSLLLNHMPFGPYIKSVAKTYFPRPPGPAIAAQTEAAETSYVEQIKGRNFEVPGCGGFLLTGKAEDLEHYYELGKEVVCFGGLDELVAKIRYYLKHDEERAVIAESGCRRTLREHTYSHRFGQIFEQIGCAGVRHGNQFEESTRPGSTQEV